MLPQSRRNQELFSQRVDVTPISSVHRQRSSGTRLEAIHEGLEATIAENQAIHNGLAEIHRLPLDTMKAYELLLWYGRWPARFTNFSLQWNGTCLSIGDIAFAGSEDLIAAGLGNTLQTSQPGHYYVAREVINIRRDRQAYQTAGHRSSFTSSHALSVRCAETPSLPLCHSLAKLSQQLSSTFPSSIAANY